GKAMAGGFPLFACIGTPEVMRRWGKSTGEALHTSTFLGNPLGCAMALATLEILEHEKLMVRAARLGQWLMQRVQRWPERFPQVGDIRGIGLMIGFELITDGETRAPNPELAWSVVEAALQQGIILLSGGAFRNVLTLSPPLTITQEQLSFGLAILEHLLGTSLH
ncbi:MAG: aminotransferase class III-fold pyridoxal phosphate-dependent enzyme, partial [Elusimicrobia bacterium]|nr:aminotransferase class III-fold pyridoxal phosphate-dependent enzyme [Elusimicrobiota bacterium]